MTHRLAVAAAALACGACGSPKTSPAPSLPPTSDPPAAAAPAPAAPEAPLSSVPLIPRADFFGNPTRAQPRLSPDGKQLLWLAPRDGVLNVWVAPVDNLEAAKPVTEEKGRPPRNVMWSESGKHILYTNDKGGDENFQLYGVELASGKTRALTPIDKVRVTIVGTSKAKKDQILVGLNNRDPRFHDVHRLDLDTGKLTLVLKNEMFGGFTADESLALRIAMKPVPGGGSSYFRLDAKGKAEAQPFMTVDADDALTTQVWGFTTDGKTLLAVDSRGRDTGALVAMPWPRGEAKVLGEHPKSDISDVMLNPTTGAAEAFAAEYLEQEWKPIGDAVKDDLAMLDRALEGAFTIESRDNADRVWVIGENRSDAPYTYHLYDRKAKKVSKLFTTRPELENKQLAKMKGVEITARDGLVLTAFLTLPPGSDADGDSVPDSPRPLVLNVHGGPWARDGLGFDGEAQWAANRGWATLQVNYRGSSGLGKKFINAATGEFAGKMHDDLIDAVQWALGRKIARADRVAIYGGSYGGYATLVGMTFTPDTFACGVDIVGPSSLVTLIESFPAYWQPFLESTWYKRVGDPRKPEGRAHLLSRSPITKADQIRRPLLIAQGANDPRVTQKESDQLVAAMKAKSIPVTYVLYGDEGHGFARPENRTSFYAVSEAFLARCLGGTPEPIGDALKAANVTVPAGAEHVPGLAAAVPKR
jgi:dipeptidyl aminopeptidase/acylaminoacyl peptidase